MIRNGRGLMPSYDRIGELDRWDVVNYLRGLQGKYTVETGAVGLPGETGDKVPGPSQMGPTRPVPYYFHAGSQAGYAPGGPAVPAGEPGSSPMGGGAGAATDSAAAPAPATAPAAGDSARRSTTTTAAPGGAR
jgi:hypothetical protein